MQRRNGFFLALIWCLLWLAACAPRGVTATPPTTTTPAIDSQATAAALGFETWVAATGTALHLTAQATLTASQRAAASSTAFAGETATPTVAPASATPASTLAPLPTRPPTPTASPLPCAERVCVAFNPNPADPHGAVTLSWNAPQASYVGIHWFDKASNAQELPNQPASGVHTFDLTQVKFQDIWAWFDFWTYNQAGDSITNPISVPLKTSLTFKTLTVSPVTVAPGDSFTLTWEVTGAESLTLTKLDAVGRMTNDSQTLPLSGSRVIQTDSTYRSVMPFLFYASGGELSLSQYVSVNLTCSDKWFFANPPALCAGVLSYLRLVEQHFQRGVMIWRSWGTAGQIYVFYGGGGELFPDLWQAGTPESDPTLTPPAGYYQPVRGFGKLWREDKSYRSGQPLRDLLGWATEPEFSFDGAYQCDTLPKYGACYLGDPAGAVYVTGPSASDFHLWAGPTPAP